MISAISGQNIIRRELIKQSSRFRDEHVWTAKQEFFLKTALTEEFNQKITQQVAGSTKLAELLDNTGWLTPEKMVASGDDWLAVVWLPDGPLATKEQFRAGQNFEALDDFAKIAARLDELAADNLDQPGSKPIKLSRHRLEPKIYSQRVLEKFEPYLSRPDFDEEVIKVGLDYFEQRIAHFIATYQHGDLTPWHVFKDGRQFVLVDCEHVNDDWPRFYDIANFYSKLRVEFDLSTQAEELMDNFGRLRQQDARASEAFWAIVVLRTLRRAIEHQESPEIVRRAFKLSDKITTG